MTTPKKPGGNPAALLPILVFLVLYLGMGLFFEYGLRIYQGFYNIPIVVVFLAALMVACLQNRTLKFDDKLAVMAQGVGDRNIMTMILIFLVAGVFVGVTGRDSAEAVAYFLLSVAPAWASVAALSAATILAQFSLFRLRILGEWDMGRGQDLTCFKKVSPASDMPSSLMYCIRPGKLSSRFRNACRMILLILARVYILVGNSRKKLSILSLCAAAFSSAWLSSLLQSRILIKSAALFCLSANKSDFSKAESSVKYLP